MQTVALEKEDRELLLGTKRLVEELLETMEVLEDSELVADIVASRKEAKEGKRYAFTL